VEISAALRADGEIHHLAFQDHPQLVFNEIRRRKRHPTFSLDTTSEEDDRPFQAPDPGAKSPDITLLDAEMQGAIQAAIETLPETQRMAIILRRYEDISTKRSARFSISRSRR
jgi:RNA polymerase sigma-70 factor (ECF subfamily)